MGESFDLSDVIGSSTETPAHFLVRLPGLNQCEDPAFDGAGGAADRRIRAGDCCPLDYSLHALRALADAAPDLVDVDSFVPHAEHTTLEWSQVLRQIPQILSRLLLSRADATCARHLPCQTLCFLSQGWVGARVAEP